MIKKYRIGITLIDAGYANDTVVTFCSEYVDSVYPILGRDRPARNQTIKEFAKFTTKQGTHGFRIIVDHYKDRMGSSLRREWYDENGIQSPYHFNAPIDCTDKQLKELTVESRRKKTDTNGRVSYHWHRPSNARNELFDLLGYGFASVEIIAWEICVQYYEMETVEWDQFWQFIETNKMFYCE